MANIVKISGTRMIEVFMNGLPRGKNLMGIIGGLDPFILYDLGRIGSGNINSM